jgi:hypothetical protein
MPRYYFSITNCQPFDDVDGLELADLTVAREEAGGVALDLMRMEPSRGYWLGWSVRRGPPFGGRGPQLQAALRFTLLSAIAVNFLSAAFSSSRFC